MESGLYKFECCKIPLKTKLNISFFEFMLADYEDAAAVEFLEYGFPIGFSGKLNKSLDSIKTHKGMTEFPNEVQKCLKKEKSYGAI